MVRPRWLYASVFVWISITGGRFLAPLLQDVGLTDPQIGLCLALSTIVQSVCSSVFGMWADKCERLYPSLGRAVVLSAGITMASLVFVAEGVLSLSTKNSSSSNNEKFVLGHVILRCIYAVSTSMVFPVLDGLTLDFLSRQNVIETSTNGTASITIMETNEKHENNIDSRSVDRSSKEGYGQERLWGAVSWAITNLIIGPSLDHFGFKILYVYGVAATAFVIVTVVWFTVSQRQNDTVYTSIGPGQNDTPEVATMMDEGPSTHSLKRQKSHFVEDTKVDHDHHPFRKLLRLIFATSLGVVFLFAFFCLSIGTAVVESLVFLFFEQLGSSFTLCALTVLLTVIFEIPIFHVAPKLLKAYGSTNMLLMACLCYITRVVGYSLVPKGQPWWVLLFEPLHGITYACASLSSVDFVANLVPVGYEASGQGMLQSLRGSGSVLGLLFGGWGAEALGQRTMYRTLATVVTIGFTILLLASRRDLFEQTIFSDVGEKEIGTKTKIDDGRNGATFELVRQIQRGDS